MPRSVFWPANTRYEYTSEDPRVLLHGGTYYMTYTANGDPDLAPPPLNRHQGIATCTSRCHLPGQWTRRCTAKHPCLHAGVKSGAMLPSSKPGGMHYSICWPMTFERCPRPGHDGGGVDELEPD